MTDPFAHLHVHSAHSVLDGLGRLGDICASAAQDDAWAAAGMEPAIAITDHGNLSGAWKFANIARRLGVKPLMGCEFYVAIESDDPSDETPARLGKHFLEVSADDLDLDSGASDRGDKNKKKQKRYEHITVIAITHEGWQNLVKLNNLAHEPEAVHYKPRIDIDLLCELNAGLVVLTGCLGGPIAGSLARGDEKRAHRIMNKLHDAFSDGQEDPRRKRVFVEVMEHGIEIEAQIMPKLLRLAKKFNVETVATNDAHFVEPEHDHHHDAWLCTNTRTTLSDPNRWRFNGEGYHLRSAAEMRALFDDQNGTSRSVSNSLLIAEMADPNVIGDADHLRIPEFKPPVGWEPSDRAKARGYEGSTAYLYDRVMEGALVRYDPRRELNGKLPPEVSKRLRFEFETITSMGLGDYFLIVEDLISWARENGIRVGPGRGSAAGCCVSYCLGIVQVEPIANGLLFERFLNTERAGMPDIDIDFDAAGRDRVFDYLADRWGTQFVARLGTFGVSLSKGSLRAAARVLGTFDAGEMLSRAVPIDTGGKPMSLTRLTDEANEAGDDFRRRLESSQDARDIMELAVGFEGVIDKEGVHACGVVVSDEPLDALVPYRYNKAGQKVTQWDGSDIDQANFLKIDALALRNLDIVSAAVELIKKTTGEDLNEPRILGTFEDGEPILGLAKIDSPPLDPNDPDLSDVEQERCRAAWHLIAQGQTSGVFQMESPGMTQLCIDIRAENLNDLSAIVALYRPGPLGEKMHERYAERKHGREPVDYGIFTRGSANEEAEQAVIAEILDETYGVPVYQESLMQLGEVVSGFGPGEKNRLRKAVSKKNKEEMAEVGELFIEGATEEHFDDDGELTKIAFDRTTAERLWDAIKSAGDYSFNKAHSAAYGWLAYITAYLKANWPVEYGAALLSVTSKGDKRLAALTSLRDEGIEVLAPSVNVSEVRTTVMDGRVVLGLSEIGDVGLADAEAVVTQRGDQRYRSLGEFIRRSYDENNKRLVKASVVDALIEAGACDDLAPAEYGRTCRLGMLVMSKSIAEHEDLEPLNLEWGVLKKARLERQRLGVLLSEHPLSFDFVDSAASEAGDEVSIKQAEEQARRFSNQVQGMTHRQIRPQPLREATTDSSTNTIITSGLVAQWSESSGDWGRRASFTLDAEGAWIAGTAWDTTLREAKESGDIPQVGDVVVIAGRKRLRKVREGDNGDMETASGERPELTAYMIKRVEVDDPDDRIMEAEITYLRPAGLEDEPEPDNVPEDEPEGEPESEDRSEPDPGETPLADPVTTAAEDLASDQISGEPAPPDRPNGTGTSGVQTEPFDQQPEPAERTVTEIGSKGSGPGPAQPPDRTLRLLSTTYGALLRSCGAIRELPWVPGKRDEIIVEVSLQGRLDNDGIQGVIEEQRSEVVDFLALLARINKEGSSGANEAELSTFKRFMSGRALAFSAAGDPPRRTFIVLAGDTPGEAAERVAAELLRRREGRITAA